MSKSVQDNVVETAYVEAIRVLRDCAHAMGMKASAHEDEYHQVWARDSMITLLGACLVGDKKIDRALKASIDILRRHQTSLGLIPNNVDVVTKQPNFQAYADSGLWFVIGNGVYFERTNNKAFLEKNYSAIKKTLNWYQYQDAHGDGLIAMQEACDWEDMFAVRGKGLFINVLHVSALKKASHMARVMRDKNNSRLYEDRSKRITKQINRRFWCSKEKILRIIIEDSFGTIDDPRPPHDREYNKRVSSLKHMLKNDSYYLPYLTFRDFGKWFDSFANLMAILGGIAGPKRAEHVISLIERYKFSKPFPIRSIYPSIRSGEEDWRNYYTYCNLNVPNQYHNGGIWPFLGGLYVAALVKMKQNKKAEKALAQLALLNKRGKEGEWEFNEWFHGKTGKPMGMVGQAWSAGMYVYAYECVNKKNPIFF